MRTNKIILGAFQFKVLAALERAGANKFTIKTVSNLFPESSLSMVRKTLSKLAMKGRIYRIKRGRYYLVPLKEEGWALNNLVLVPEFFPEGYVSFTAAMQYYGWTTQLPSTIHVVTPRFARPRKFRQVQYIPVRVSKKIYNGYLLRKIAGAEVRIALREKLILDCLRHPQYCGGVGEICRAIKLHYKEIKWDSVRYFLDALGNSAVERRLYYCLKLLKFKKTLEKLGAKKFLGYRRLDSSLPTKGKFDSKDGLLVNVDLEEELR